MYADDSGRGMVLNWFESASWNHATVVCVREQRLCHEYGHQALESEIENCGSSCIYFWNFKCVPILVVVGNLYNCGCHSHGPGGRIVSHL